MSEKTFQDSMAFPILFMLITSLIFVGVLAVMFRSSEAKIQEHLTSSYQQMILSLFSPAIAEATNAKPLSITNDYPQAYEQYINEIKIEGLPNRIFTATVNDTILGYCFDIGDKGLWGSMRALVAMSKDIQSLKGMIIYDQMETPGLGGRISEPWFLEQFKDIAIIDPASTTEDKVVNFEYIPEGKQATSKLQIQKITGATITTTSVVTMLKTELNTIYAVMQRQGAK